MNDRLRSTDHEIVRVLSGLRESEWQAPSLCSEWTIRQVALHLASANIASIPYVASRTLAHRGDINRANLDVVDHLDSTLTNDELVRAIAANAGRRRRAGRLLPPPLMLGDHLIHLLDIAVPLERTVQLGRDALIGVLRTQLGVPNPFVPAARFGRGLRFEATDLGWRSRRGSLRISGTAADLALTLAGRTAALHRLEGDGVTELTARLDRWNGSNPRSRRATTTSRR